MIVSAFWMGRKTEMLNLFVGYLRRIANHRLRARFVASEHFQNDGQDNHSNPLLASELTHRVFAGSSTKGTKRTGSKVSLFIWPT